MKILDNTPLLVIIGILCATLIWSVEVRNDLMLERGNTQAHLVKIEEDLNQGRLDLETANIELLIAKRRSHSEIQRLTGELRYTKQLLKASEYQVKTTTDVLERIGKEWQNSIEKERQRTTEFLKGQCNEVKSI